LTDVTTPTYTHFPTQSSFGGYTGSLLGPAMLGIAPLTSFTATSPSTNNNGTYDVTKCKEMFYQV